MVYMYIICGLKFKFNINYKFLVFVLFCFFFLTVECHFRLICILFWFLPFLGG